MHEGYTCTSGVNSALVAHGNGETDEQRQERLAKRRERNRLRREGETDEERQARLVNVKLNPHNT